MGDRRAAGGLAHTASAATIRNNNLRCARPCLRLLISRAEQGGEIDIAGSLTVQSVGNNLDAFDLLWCRGSLANSFGLAPIHRKRYPGDPICTRRHYPDRRVRHLRRGP
jgi:hypothetical protein